MESTNGALLIVRPDAGCGRRVEYPAAVLEYADRLPWRHDGRRRYRPDQLFGNLAGFVAPYLMGFLTDLTHSTLSGMLIISCTLFVGAAAIFLIPGRIVNR